MDKRIILFELNEVPLRIIDQFCRWHPESALARHLTPLVEVPDMEKADPLHLSDV